MTGSIVLGRPEVLSLWDACKAPNDQTKHNSYDSKRDSEASTPEQCIFKPLPNRIPTKSPSSGNSVEISSTDEPLWNAILFNDEVISSWAGNQSDETALTLNDHSGRAGRCDRIGPSPYRGDG